MRAISGALIVLMVALAGCGSGRHTPAAVGPGTRPVPSSASITTTTTLPAATTAPATTTPTVPATTARTAPVPTAAPKPVSGGGVAIGDSVLEDVQIYARDTLASRGISINAAVSRQWPVGVSIASQLQGAGKLPPVVIVALGSNGVVTAPQFDQMMQACAGAKRVVFMTVTGPLVANNPVITAGVGRYPNAALADWAALVAAHADWLAPDHVHIGPAGSAALGNLLASKA